MDSEIAYSITASNLYYCDEINIFRNIKKDTQSRWLITIRYCRNKKGDERSFQWSLETSMIIRKEYIWCKSRVNEKRSSKNVYNNIYGGKHCHMLVCKLSFDYDQYTYKRNHTFDYVTCFIFKILKQSLSSIHYEHFQWKENNCGRWINLVHYKIFADAYSNRTIIHFPFLLCVFFLFFSFFFYKKLFKRITTM